ncbi:hypothetical protein LTR85_002134 [Meristemomyces frigidus]|nr:hypothetical protein LTR85_002134 [Meristemomyces frigidus]
MASSGLLEALMPVSISSVLLTVAIGSLASLIVYRAFFDPLRGIPGPLICRITSLWTYWHSYIGDDCSKIGELHKRYGPVLRIAPNEVSISDGAALAPIYSERGGFMKAPCYANFDIEGHSTIFSTRDPGHRAVRSKAVVPVFSTSNLRSGTDTIEGCVAKMIARLKEEAVESRDAIKTSGKPKPVNVLNIARSLAVDAVSSYLFGQTFGGVSEKTDKMSANGYVDTLVAVGRFFFLPNWVFLALETSRQKLWPDKIEDESAHKVDGFVETLVKGSAADDSTYQGRLLKAGISKQEVEVQCKDLIFAGTDSTGTNLSTICWQLAKRPEVYTTLRKEIEEADARDPSYNPQSLPYLDAVIREGLRVSMANPTRFPRIVPSQGFDFEARNGQRFYLPAGTQVGMQPYTLHFNPDVFSEPFAYKPERWLDDPTPEMQRDAIPFGLGSRQCIARNLATMELFLAVRAIARENVLEGAQAVGEKIELMEWFNSKVKGETIEITWQ